MQAQHKFAQRMPPSKSPLEPLVMSLMWRKIAVNLPLDLSAQSWHTLLQMKAVVLLERGKVERILKRNSKMQLRSGTRKNYKNNGKYANRLTLGRRTPNVYPGNAPCSASSNSPHDAPRVLHRYATRGSLRDVSCYSTHESSRKSSRVSSKDPSRNAPRDATRDSLRKASRDLPHNATLGSPGDKNFMGCLNDSDEDVINSQFDSPDSDPRCHIKRKVFKSTTRPASHADLPTSYIQVPTPEPHPASTSNVENIQTPNCFRASHPNGLINTTVDSLTSPETDEEDPIYYDYSLPGAPALDFELSIVENIKSETECTETAVDMSSRVEQAFTLPRSPNHANVEDAPVFYPTAAEFSDPLVYFEKIAKIASKFGIAKIVAPPGFKPTCTLTDDIRFNVSNQYIARMYRRWGTASREMSAYLALQSDMLTHAPLYEGIEVNLPRLYHIVQRNGGLKKVIEKKRWGRVAEGMHFTRGANPDQSVEPEEIVHQLYVKYLLPYDKLVSSERQEIMNTVERCWNRKIHKMLDRALNPLHRQKRMLGESDSSGEDTEYEGNVACALAEVKDCVVPGQNMNVTTFQNAATSTAATLFPSTEHPTPEEVEQEYWRMVLLGTEHVCVNSASIDTGENGVGFTKNQADPFGRHPWNLKMLSQNSGNVLRLLGPVRGVTVPKLQLGMMFSTSCWHRDPHGLPLIDYMHDGPPKIWYGITGEQSDVFRKATETLCPISCQNKSIWLPSDVAMIPPNLLGEHNVSLKRLVQCHGEFIMVFPKAYSCSISTGFTKSESVSFATTSWLTSATQVFQEMRNSCEPAMFSLEQLLLSVARNPRTPLRVLADMITSLCAMVRDEKDARKALARFGVQLTEAHQSRLRQDSPRPSGACDVLEQDACNVLEQDECEICHSKLYLSKVTGLMDNQSSVCLRHALQLLRSGKCPTSCTLIDYYPVAELDEVLDAAERRLNVMSSRNTSQRRASTASTVAPDY